VNYRFVIISIFLVFALGCARRPGNIVTTVPPAEADAIINKGIRLHDQHRYAEAIQLYNGLLKRDPNNTRAIYEMGYSYAANHQLQKAMETADRGIRIAKNPTMLYLLKGNCLDDLGKPREALACYRDGLKRSPDEYLLYYNMGLTLFRMKKYGKAEKAFQHSSVLNPNHPTSQMMLGQLWEAEHMRIQAVFAYMRFLSLEPNSPRAKLIVTELRRILSSGVTKTKKGTAITLNLNDLLGKKNAYTDLNVMLSLNNTLILSKEGIAGKTDMDKMCFQLSRLFKFMAEHHTEANDFAWKYYSNYYRTLADKKLTQAFCMTALQSAAPGEAEIWQKTHKEQLTAFRKWNRAYKFPGKEIL